MDPVLMFIIALSLPVIFAALLFGPIYGGVCVALYFVFGDEAWTHIYEPFYMIDLYDRLYQYWLTYHEMLGWRDFMLPVFGPLVVGTLLGMYWCRLFVRYIKNIWHI